MSNIDFNLYLITDRLNIPAGTTLLNQVESALRGGVRAVQLREKDLSPKELLPLALQMRQLTAKYGAKLLINSCLETTLAVAADGIHLTSIDPPIIEIRKKMGANRLIGISTHSVTDIESAVNKEADFVTFGPIYHTASKAKYGNPLGLAELKKACAISTIPVFALGGITPEKIAELKESGCAHFACIGAILNSDNPETVVHSFLSR